MSPIGQPRLARRLLTALLLLGAARAAFAQHPDPVREFPAGSLRELDQLPAGRLRAEVDRLEPIARQQALQWLRSFHLTERDLDSLQADARGGIYYACRTLAPAAPADPPLIAPAAVPLSPYPASLIFHSRPGAPSLLYLNFGGENVTNTEWNSVVERSEIPALPFSTDSDTTTFSDAEQLAIRRIWQRVAEDYAPFNIDVTTERPATFTTRTAHALITRNTDANGDPNPASTSGGVAYVNVFGISSYARYRPAWIYHNNLANAESYVAGLDPNDPASQFRFTGRPAPGGAAYILQWTPVSGRLYTIWTATGPQAAFTPLPAAVDLPATINSFTHEVGVLTSPCLYRISVRLP